MDRPTRPGQTTTTTRPDQTTTTAHDDATEGGAPR